MKYSENIKRQIFNSSASTSYWITNYSGDYRLTKLKLMYLLQVYIELKFNMEFSRDFKIG